MHDHFSAFLGYSVLVGVLFSIFMRDGLKERLKFAAALAGGMIGIAIAMGWLLFLVG